MDKKEKIKLEDVQFIKHTGYGKLGKFVTLSSTSSQLYFNYVLSRESGLVEWEQAMVGYTEDGMIILKKCDPEELGSILVKEPCVNRNKKNSESAKDTRMLSIGHLIPALKNHGILGRKYLPSVQKPTASITLIVLRKVQ